MVLFGTVVQKCWVPPFGTTSERNLNSLFIMNSAGEEDEEQVDYEEDSGGEKSMSFNGQARSTTWRRMLCSRCIPADLLPGSGLTVNIEILPASHGERHGRRHGHNLNCQCRGP